MKIVIGENEAGQRLDKFLRKWLKDAPLGFIYKSIRIGDVKINGKKSKEKYMLQVGDVLVTRDITTKAGVKHFLNAEIALKITYEDENMLLVEKWPDLLVHRDSKTPEDEPTLTDYVLTYLFNKGAYNPEDEITFTPSPCNRLDRNTSGIVIYAKNYEALKELNQMIKDRDIRKYYVAIVNGTPKEGIHTGYIKKDPEANLSIVYEDEKKDSKKIETSVRIIQSCGSYSELELELLTGRSHQLRAHLKQMGCPIIGDPKYGNKSLNSYFFNKYKLNYQYLYAYKLFFKDAGEKLKYMKNKTITQGLPQVLKRIKNDVFKF